MSRHQAVFTWRHDYSAELGSNPNIYMYVQKSIQTCVYIYTHYVYVYYMLIWYPPQLSTYLGVVEVEVTGFRFQLPTNSLYA